MSKHRSGHETTCHSLARASISLHKYVYPKYIRRMVADQLSPNSTRFAVCNVLSFSAFLIHFAPDFQLSPDFRVGTLVTDTRTNAPYSTGNADGFDLR